MVSQEKSGAEGSRTLDLLNAMRRREVVAVLGGARPCAKPGAYVAGRDRHKPSRTVRPAQNPYSPLRSPFARRGRVPYSAFGVPGGIIVPGV
jgi:hypothetical protein